MKDTFSFLFHNRSFLLALLALVLATLVLAALLSGWPGGTEVPPAPDETISSLDLRGTDVRIPEYLALKERYPNAEIRWDVPVGSGTFDSESTSILVPDYSAADRAALDLFPRLRAMDASGSKDYDALLSLWKEKPNFSVDWTVPVGDRVLPSRSASLLVNSDSVTARELGEAMARFPDIHRVIMDNCDYSADERASLRSAWPNVQFRWPVTVCGQAFPSTAEEISLAGRTDLTAASLREIREKMDQFESLRTVDLSDCGFDGETLHAFDQTLGDAVDVAWTFDLYGVPVRSTDREIDVSYQRITDVGKAVEAVIPWMTHLEKVVMCEANVPNKNMIELYEKYLPQGIRFVWMVQIKWAGIRTDSDHFIPYPESGARQYPANSMVGLSNLYYCPDLIALDLGHSNIKDLGYLNIMPHLKYLILADSWVADITDVGNLKELEWLELFQTGVKDLSPLVGCTSLKHLNICYIIAPGDNIYETLRQMTWLERIWCCGCFMTPEQVASLKEELPNCEIWDKMGDESTGSTWRYHPAYYEMRDAFHMYYMNVDGNTVGRLSDEEIEAMHKKYWKD